MRPQEMIPQVTRHAAMSHTNVDDRGLHAISLLTDCASHSRVRLLGAEVDLLL
jgi:hypothetical protein